MAEPVERMPTTGKGLMPALGSLVLVVVLVLALADGWHPVDAVVLAACAFGAAVLAAVFLRPAVWATQDSLVMRNMVDTVEIPLAAIEKSAVSRVFVVFADDKRYVSPAVSRTIRKAMGAARSNEEAFLLGAAPTRQAMTSADFVEHRVSQLAEDARIRTGVRARSEEQRALAAGVRRTRSWPTISVLLVTLAALVVTIVR